MLYAVVYSVSCCIGWIYRHGAIPTQSSVITCWWRSIQGKIPWQGQIAKYSHTSLLLVRDNRLFIRNGLVLACEYLHRTECVLSYVNHARILRSAYFFFRILLTDVSGIQNLAYWMHVLQGALLGALSLVPGSLVEKVTLGMGFSVFEF